MHELLALLLKVAGHPLDKVSPTLSRSEVATILRDQVELLAGFDEHRVEAFIKTYAHNVTLTATSPAGCFDGDVLYFCATREKPADDFAGDMWRSFIRGNFEIHDIACEHQAMTQPGPIAEIGRILGSHLRNIASSASWE